MFGAVVLGWGMAIAEMRAKEKIRIDNMFHKLETGYEKLCQDLPDWKQPTWEEYIEEQKEISKLEREKREEELRLRLIEKEARRKAFNEVFNIRP